MVEQADTHGLGPCALGRAGSTPAFGTKKLYGKEVEGVLRSTFVIDEDGTVELAQYNVKATGHVAKLRRDLGLG